jgi:hypothetical protein
MTDQPFAVLALPRYLTDRGNRPPIAGFIGYELLARFAARLDYDNRTRWVLLGAAGTQYIGEALRHASSVCAVLIGEALRHASSDRRALV